MGSMNREQDFLSYNASLYTHQAETFNTPKAQPSISVCPGAYSAVEQE